MYFPARRRDAPCEHCRVGCRDHRGAGRPAAWGVAGAQLWTKYYNGPGNGFDGARSLAASPDGTKVYVTGTSTGANGFDYATVAYSATDGTQLWVKRYNGPANSSDDARSIAVSPDGTKVYVTGGSTGVNGSDYATVAYNATDGTQLWVKRYNGPANGSDGANSVGVSPDGTKVYVTGASTGVNDSDYATVAYNATDGTQLWVKRYNGPANRIDTAFDVAVSTDSTKVFVTGASESVFNGNFRDDYATIAYDSVNGSQLWATRFDDPFHENDDARSIGVSPDGTKVFVTGYSALGAERLRLRDGGLQHGRRHPVVGEALRRDWRRRRARLCVQPRGEP